MEIKMNMRNENIITGHDWWNSNSAANQKLKAIENIYVFKRVTTVRAKGFRDITYK